MSIALLRKELSIFNEDDETDSKNSRKKGTKRKKLPKLRNFSGKKSNFESVIGKYQKEVDYTESNLEYLMKLSKPCTSRSDTAEMLETFEKISNRKKPVTEPEKKKRKKEEETTGTPFTDEDFKKFEKEFFGAF